MSKAQFDKHEDHVFLGRWRKLAYGMTGFADGLLNDTIGTTLMLYYNTVLQVNATAIGLALFVPRAWDIVSDPLMGHISDNTHTRWGRRRPYLLIGSILLPISFLIMWMPWSGFSNRGAFWYLTVAGLIYYTIYTLTFVPAAALGAELSIDYHERTRINSYRGFLNRAGSWMAGLAWPIAAGAFFVSKRTGIITVTVVYSFIAVICLLGTFFGTREEAGIQLREKVSFLGGLGQTIRCKPLWMLGGIILSLMTGALIGFPAFNYIIIYYLYGGDAKAAAPLMAIGATVFSWTCVLGVFPMTWLALRIGKERALLVGTILFALAPIVSWFVFTPEHPYRMLIFSVTVALAMSSVSIFPNAMLADLVDLDEVKTNCRREGSYSSLMSFIFKIPGPFGMLIFGALLDNVVGFHPELTVQTPETVLRLRLLLFIAPLICFSVAMLLTLFYPIREKQVREVRRLLEEHRLSRLQELDPKCAEAKP